MLRDFCSLQVDSAFTNKSIGMQKQYEAGQMQVRRSPNAGHIHLWIHSESFQKSLQLISNWCHSHKPKIHLHKHFDYRFSFSIGLLFLGGTKPLLYLSIVEFSPLRAECSPLLLFCMKSRLFIISSPLTNEIIHSLDLWQNGGDPGSQREILCLPLFPLHIHAA